MGKFSTEGGTYRPPWPLWSCHSATAQLLKRSAAVDYVGR